MIPLMRNTFFNEQQTKKALSEFIISADRLSMGDKCREFEIEFAKFHGMSYAVLFNSGASANLALLQTMLNLGYLKKGDRVGFSALTWATNVMPIIQMGLVPVPLDCSIETLNVMSHNIIPNKNWSRDIQALFITNALGFAGDLDQIRNICNEKNIIMLEDNCESLGTQIGDKYTGTFGDASTFSFYVAHHLSTIEGGMVCTDSPDMAEMLCLVRANGWDRNLTPEQQSKWRRTKGLSDHDAKYAFYDLAYNLRPTEVTGFLGCEQMKYLPTIIEARWDTYRDIEETARENSDLIKLDVAHLNVISNFSYPVICRTEELKVKYLRRFEDAGIETRPVIAGNIQRQPFWKKYSLMQRCVLNTDHIHDCGFYCGNYPEMTFIEVETIKECLT